MCTTQGVKTFSSHSDWITSIAWSANSEYHVLTASHDKTSKLWDTRTAISLHTLEGHTDKVQLPLCTQGFFCMLHSEQFQLVPCLKMQAPCIFIVLALCQASCRPLITRDKSDVTQTCSMLYRMCVLSSRPVCSAAAACHVCDYSDAQACETSSYYFVGLSSPCSEFMVGA